MLPIHVLLLVAVLGWLCAAGALWRARRLQRALTQTRPAGQTEVELRLKQLTNAPAPTRRYTPGNSTSRPLGKRISGSIG